MLGIRFRKVKPECEARLRAWFSELSRRADEVRETFRDETTRHEQAFLLQTRDGLVLVYAMEVGDLEVGLRAFEKSPHPIDAEHRQVMKDCLGETPSVELLYDVALEDNAS